MSVALTSRRVAASARARRVPLALTAALLAACTDPVTGPETGVVLESEYQLLFVLSTNEVANIYRMNPDGTGRERLTDNASTGGIFHSMDVSPDGRQVAMRSNYQGCAGIRVMNVDGSGFRDPAPDDPWCPHMPRWSRDGKQLAFMSRGSGGYPVIAVGVDGIGRHHVSASVDAGSNFMNHPVTWAPDGRLAFDHTKGGLEWQAYVAQADGSGLERLPGPLGAHTPAWSPDGAMVAFLLDVGGQPALHVMNADGSGVRRLTNHDRPDRSSVSEKHRVGRNTHQPWSPSGEYLAFFDDGGTVQVIRPDGTGYRELTSGGATFAGWSPDGRVTLELHDDIYLIAPDGSGLVNITATAGEYERNVLWTRRWSDE